MLGVRVSFSKSHCLNILAFCSLKQLVLTELKLAHSKLVLYYLNILYHPPQRSGNFITL